MGIASGPPPKNTGKSRGKPQVSRLPGIKWFVRLKRLHPYFSRQDSRLQRGTAKKTGRFPKKVHDVKHSRYINRCKLESFLITSFFAVRRSTPILLLICRSFRIWENGKKTRHNLTTHLCSTRLAQPSFNSPTTGLLLQICRACFRELPFCWRLGDLKLSLNHQRGDSCRNHDVLNS